MSQANYNFTITKAQREALALKREWTRHHLAAWAPVEQVPVEDTQALLKQALQALWDNHYEYQAAQRKGKGVAWVMTDVMRKRNGKYEVRGREMRKDMVPVVIEHKTSYKHLMDIQSFYCPFSASGRVRPAFSTLHLPRER